MIKRSISLPVKPQEEKQQCLERSEEIEELCEELCDNDDDNQVSDRLYKYSRNRSSGDNFHDDDNNQSNGIELTQKMYENETDQELETRRHKRNLKFFDEDQKHLEETFLSSNNDNNDKENFARVIDKSGRRNINLIKIPKRPLRYCKDFVTTLIDQRWRYTIAVFVGSFILSWVIFTMLWYLIAYAHGDLLFDENGKRLGEGKEPCIIGGTSLTAIFIHSVEIQSTIGFGEKYPSEHCPESVFLFVVHIIISIALEGAMIGIIYSKMSRPVKYVAEYKFSKKAVICTRDDKLCLIFRVCDPGEHQAINTTINAYVLLDTKTAEGETLMKIRKELQIYGSGDSKSSSPILIWPETVCHVIDERSPLYDCVQIETQEFIKDFEIYVSLVGSSPSMGQITESKTSYLPCEIQWSHRFVNIITYDWEKGTYFVDYNNFNTIVPLKK